MSWLSANPSSNISTAVSKFNFSTPGGVSDIAKYGADFINTNSLIGKIAFLFMILILFVILLRFGIMLIGVFIYFGQYCLQTNCIWNSYKKIL